MELISTLLSAGKQATSLALGLAGIGFLIGLHELGHFIFCKIFSVKTPSFSIGFGPILFKKKIGDTLFSLSLIPIGGYVEIAGSEEVGQGEQKESKRNDSHSFKTKSYIQKILIMSGGIIFNFLFAYVIIIGLLTTGMPQTPLLYPQNATTSIAAVQPKSAAQIAGLQAGDTIISINNTNVENNHTQLLRLLKPLANEQTTITIKRNNITQTLNITPDSTATGTGLLGIIFATQALSPRSFNQAIKEGIGITNNLIWQVVNSLKSLFIKREMNGVGGPLMIISATIKSANQGIKLFLLLLAFISANLAVLNLLPLPILDGGQIVTVTIEALAGRELPEKAKLYIHYACWYGFLALLIYLTYKDIGRIISSFF